MIRAGGRGPQSRVQWRSSLGTAFLCAAVGLLCTAAGPVRAQDDQAPPSAEAAEPESAAQPEAIEPTPGPVARALTLEQAINRALMANRGLLNARDRMETAELSLVQAESEFELKFIPRGEAGAVGDFEGATETQERYGAGLEMRQRFATFGTVVSVEPNVQRIGDFYRSGVDTTLTQPLLRGLNREFNLSRVQGAEFSQRSAARAEYLTRVDTVLATVSGVYNIIRQREAERLNAESAERLRGHYEAAKVKEGIGMTTAIDTYRAGLELNQAEDNLTNARQAHEDAIDSLRVLLALPLDEALQVEAPLTYDLVRMADAEAVRVALRSRVELDNAADLMRDLERQSRVARHNTFPDLDINFTYSRLGTGDNFNDSTNLSQDFWGVALSSSTDLARTAERAAHKQSLVNVRTSRRNLRLRHDEVVREVKRDLRSLKRSERRIAIQQEQIDQADGQLALARVKFQRGLADNFDVIDAEAELRRAQLSLIGVVFDYIVGTYRLRASLGTLVERPVRF